MKLVIKGNWSHFDLHLLRMKIKQNVFKTLFHGFEEYEKTIKRILGSFFDCLKSTTMTLMMLNLFSCILILKKINRAYVFFISISPTSNFSESRSYDDKN